jgi:hypothetical protein
METLDIDLRAVRWIRYGYGLFLGLVGTASVMVP